jgi:hypothetical protein
MDRNGFPQADYDNAFSKAAANGISIAYGNECFEVWVLLHFQYSTAQISRSKLPALITEVSGVRYSKGMEGLYELLYANQASAIRNAMNLFQYHQNVSQGQRHKWSPSTSVHELVIELNRHL